MNLWIKNHKYLLIILIFSLLFRLMFLGHVTPYSFDSGVYVGIGKYIATLGQAGLFEPIRPLVLPVMYGIGWLLHADTVIFATTLDILLSLASIFLVYKIGQRFSEKTALIAAALFSITPIYFFSSFVLLTEVMATFFSLVAVYLALKKRYMLAGIFAGLGFLTKFYHGLFIIIIGLYIIYAEWDKNIKKPAKHLLLCAAGFLIICLPYFVFNYYMYGDPVQPLLAASEIIKHVLGCNLLDKKPWFFYFTETLIENAFILFIVVGAILIIKSKNKDHAFILAAALLPLCYLLTLTCKSERYITLYLPYAVLCASFGLTWCVEKIKRHNVWHMLIIILAIFAIFTPIHYYQQHHNGIDYPTPDYYAMMSSLPDNATILTTNPSISFFTNARLLMAYYPLYNGTKTLWIKDVIERKVPDYVVLDACYGDMFCPPNDNECKQVTQQLPIILRQSYKQLYIKENDVCNISIYGN